MYSLSAVALLERLTFTSDVVRNAPPRLGPNNMVITWVGVRGIRGDWGLLDGGYITGPEDALYGGFS